MCVDRFSHTLCLNGIQHSPFSQQALASFSTDLFARTFTLIARSRLVSPCFSHRWSYIDASYHCSAHSTVNSRDTASHLFSIRLSAWTHSDDLIREKILNEKRNQESAKGERSHLAFTSLHSNHDERKQRSTMIDSGHRRQITNAHKASDPMIIAIRLCTHRTLPHHTKV